MHFLENLNITLQDINLLPVDSSTVHTSAYFSIRHLLRGQNKIVPSLTPRLAYLVSRHQHQELKLHHQASYSNKYRTSQLADTAMEDI
jgi:hypothetical protein